MNNAGIEIQGELPQSNCLSQTIFHDSAIFSEKRGVEILIVR